MQYDPLCRGTYSWIMDIRPLKKTNIICNTSVEYLFNLTVCPMIIPYLEKRKETQYDHVTNKYNSNEW